MASTFTTNYGIEKITTGEQSGTWGTTTNYNISILDRIASYAAVALSDASTATLTVRAASPTDGGDNVQNGMYRVIKFTGSLSQNCTVTVAPATTTAYFMIQNATTGGYNVIMAQGSAAQTVTVANAKAQILYCDGSDEVISVSDKLDLETFDNISISGNTISSTNTNGNIGLSPNGTGEVVVGNGSATGKVSTSGAYDLELDTNGGTNSSKITITDAANGDVSVIPNGTGELVVGSAAAAGKITSNGAYDLELDTNSGTNSGTIKIVDAANGNIELTPNGTGEVSVGSGAASGKITSNGAYDLEIDTNGGTNSGSIVITDGTNGDITIATNGTGAILCSDDILQRPILKDYGETHNALGDTGGGTDDIDLTAGNVVSATVSTGTQTFTFSKPTASANGCSFTLFLTNGGSQTVNWPGSVDWASATAPTLTTAGLDILVFTTIDGGTIWHGAIASTDSK